MKAQYFLVALLTLAAPGITFAQGASTPAKAQCECKQTEKACICSGGKCLCKTTQSINEEDLSARSPLQRAVIHAGTQRGKSRAQQLAKQESVPLLKKAYRESNIGRRAPDQFALYYKAYKRGYRQLLTQDVSEHAKDLGIESGIKASRYAGKRPSIGMVRFQAIQAHPELEGNEVALQAYTQAFYTAYHPVVHKDA